MVGHPVYVSGRWCKGGTDYVPPLHQPKGVLAGVRGVRTWRKGGTYQRRRYTYPPYTKDVPPVRH